MTSTTLAGAGTLLRFMLRRDRVRTPAWIVGLGLFALYCAFVETGDTFAGDEESLTGLGALFTDPVGRMMMGPGYGMGAPTRESFFAAGYFLFIAIGFALMSVFTVIRHTRVDEQTGRAEMVRSNVVGRHATLTAALVLTFGANLLAGVLVWLSAISAGFDVTGSLLLSAGSATTGFFFTGVAAVTAQLSEFSRSASGMAGGVIAVSYVIRMGGDVVEPGGSTLSWFSPLAWPQQTAPYVLDRWWPVLLSLGGAIFLIWLGYWLSTRRDVGASLMQTRRGRPEAAPSLGTPVGMAFRTLRGGLRSWGIALTLAGLAFGGFSQAMVDAQDSLPDSFTDIFGTADMILGYQAFMALLVAIFATAAGVSAMQQIRDEEVRGRAEYVLSVPISRLGWLGVHLVVVVGGLVVTLVVAGAGLGIGTALVLTDDGWSMFGDVFAASLAQAPAVLSSVGIVVALFGWIPRTAGPVGWVIVGFAVVMAAFGELLDLPGWMTSLNLFGHLAQYPIESVAVAPVVWLSAVGVVGLVLGLMGWRRREVNRV